MEGPTTTLQPPGSSPSSDPSPYRVLGGPMTGREEKVEGVRGGVVQPPLFQT